MPSLTRNACRPLNQTRACYRDKPAERVEGERPRQPVPARERIPAHAVAIRARRARPLAV